MLEIGFVFYLAWEWDFVFFGGEAQVEEVVQALEIGSGWIRIRLLG